MKKPLPLIGLLTLAILFSYTVNGQISFSDDFESYSPGDFIAASSSDWTTWSGGVAGEDTEVSDDFASSGSNSLKFLTTATTGGPQDVILPFGGTHNLGDFFYEMNVYIPAGQVGYYNFQAVDPPGVTWALEVYLNADETITVISDAAVVLSGTYTQGEWVNMKWDIDLTSNNWEMLVDDVSTGTFSNFANSIASLDLFPPDATTYYIDDVSFSHVPFIPSATDGLVSSVPVPTRGLLGENFEFDVTIRNTGINAITSFDVTYSDGSTDITDNITGVSVPSLEFYTFTHSATHEVAATNDITFTIENVNGLGMDDVPENDTKELGVEAVIPAPDKMVVFEEGTGTWCGWCPRGAVIMDMMGDLFPEYFAGMAVHNGDPMVVTAHDTGVGTWPGFPGYPGVVAHRNGVIDPLGIRDYFYDEIDETTPVRMQNGASYDETTREMKISVTVTAKEAIFAQNQIVVCITEDGVTGTEAGFAQTNYYAGGSNGPMGGYESLPDPVPASMMVYNHTSRALLTPFTGSTAGIPANMAEGEIIDILFTYTIPDVVNADNVHIISFLTDPAGEAITADNTSVEDAVANGYTGPTTGIADAFADFGSFSLSPNPASDVVNFEIVATQSFDARIEVYDIAGRIVSESDYGRINGTHTGSLNTSDWNTGTYFISLKNGNNSIVQQLIIQH